MKTTEFRKLIREEARKILKEETPVIDMQMLANVESALPELERLIKNQIGADVKLGAHLKRGGLEIYSNDLTKLLGNTLVKTIFKSIKVRFWGGQVARDGQSIWFNPKLEYVHPSGGSNGTDFIWQSIWYVLEDHGKYKAGEWVTGEVIF